MDGMAFATDTRFFSMATVFTARGCKGGLTGAHKESRKV